MAALFYRLKILTEGHMLAIHILNQVNSGL